MGREKKGYTEFKDEDCVLEFVKAEKLEDGSEGEGPWFLDLLRLRLLGNWATEYITDEHKEKVMNYLNHWGYEIEDGGKTTAQNYYTPEEVFKFMTEILKMLKESYESDTIPEVQYDVESRKHLMPKKRYIFQYQSRHFNVFSINAILRFLLHGMVIQSPEGNQVILKAQLLRHAFATHAVQTEKIPVDIVKTLLHQKDIEVTSYYSAPTAQQVSESINSLHENWISYVDIQKGILRGPEELKEHYDDYREKVGTMSKVVGGICTIDSV